MLRRANWQIVINVSERQWLFTNRHGLRSTTLEVSAAPCMYLRSHIVTFVTIVKSENYNRLLFYERNQQDATI
jgi:hypothetical protein